MCYCLSPCWKNEEWRCEKRWRKIRQNVILGAAVCFLSYRAQFAISTWQETDMCFWIILIHRLQKRRHSVPDARTLIELPALHSLFFLLGAYGTVYRARDRTNDSIVALKKMRFTLTEDGVPMAILREISLLKQLEKFDHPNIVR